MQPSPADSGDELVEWVDEHDRVIDVVPRARMRCENLRHRSAAVVVLSGDGRLLVHRRSDTKDLRPGWWDVCAGGVVGVGESYLEAAARELAEEMGVTGVPLEPLGVGRFDDVDSREISHLFLATSDGPFDFADGEVAEARLVTRVELTVLMDRERFLPTCDAMILPLVAGFEPSRRRRGASDRTPHEDGGADSPRAHVSWHVVQRVEFTIEPFHEGEPGLHVTAPADALRAMDIDVEVGPFGSSCRVADDRVSDVVAAIVRIALDHGASHVNVDIETAS